jgi:hypothetical protein
MKWMRDQKMSKQLDFLQLNKNKKVFILHFL